MFRLLFVCVLVGLVVICSAAPTLDKVKDTDTDKDLDSSETIWPFWHPWGFWHGGLGWGVHVGFFG